MHRYILLLLALMFLPCPALCQTAAERLAQLDVISQYEERLQEERYFYRDMYFRIAGCKPASATNAVVALLASPETNVPELLVELRNGLLYDHNDKTTGIDLYRLPKYLQSPRSSAQELLKLLEPVTSVSFLSRDMLTQPSAAILSQFCPDKDAHPLLMREFIFPDSWSWLIDMTAALCELGHPDARIALCAIGVGTTDTDGPFNFGLSGHYATLYLQANEFYNDGTFYLLDSYPRALSGEIYGYREHFPIRYPFIERPRSAFSTTYQPTRISDTIVQFTLLPKELEFLHSVAGIEHDHQLLRYCNTIVLFSNPYCMIYLP